MGEQTLKDKTANGLLWGGMSNGLIQILSALFGIVLLRLLTPDDYGKIAVLVIFSNIASNIQESGFTVALCNKKDAKHEDYNAVFWFNIIVSIGIYIILFFCAPLIAEFYHEPVLVPLSRYLFLSFVITSFGTVQRAYLFRNLMVKQTSFVMVTALVVSNLIGIALAWKGFAFWGIATQTLVYVLVISLFNWHYSPWRPTLKIDLKPAMRMFGFSSKLLITNIFNQLTSNVFGVLLGRFYGTRLAGLYNNARKWDDMCINTVNGMISGVALPVLARIKDEPERYRNVFRKMLRFVSFVSFPAMLGIGLIARELILITVGPSWEDSATLLSMLSIYGAFFPITTLYSNLVMSQGKSGINMLCTIVICIIIWGSLIALQSYGIYVMVGFFIVINILWLLVWHYFAWRLIRLSLWHVITDIVPFFVFAAGVMALTWWITKPIENLYLMFAAKVIIATILYIGITYLSGAKILRETLTYLKSKINRQ